MLQKLFMSLFFVLLFANGSAISRDATTLPPIAKVRIDVPLKIDDKVQAVIIDKLTGLEQHRFVYLDLSIDFSARDGGVPYVSTILRNGFPEQTNTACTVGGPLPMGDGRAYSLGPIANYNHLLMTFYTGPRAGYPYYEVSCEYVNSGAHEQFRIRGFFHVLANSIPTAVSLQLRPFNPPLELAAKMLAK